MYMMVRKQLYLPEDLARHLAVAAKQQRKPEAQILRELIAAGLKRQPVAAESTGQALMRLARIGGKGPADLSARIDDYLYGDD